MSCYNLSMIDIWCEYVLFALQSRFYTCNYMYWSWTIKSNQVYLYGVWFHCSHRTFFLELIWDIPNSGWINGIKKIDVWYHKHLSCFDIIFSPCKGILYHQWINIGRNKSWIIRSMMIQRWELDGNNVLWHLVNIRMWNNTTVISEQKKTSKRTPNVQATNKTNKSSPKQLK